jgi:hypothetical protein
VPQIHQPAGHIRPHPPHSNKSDAPFIHRADVGENLPRLQHLFFLDGS